MRSSATRVHQGVRLHQRADARVVEQPRDDLPREPSPASSPRLVEVPAYRRARARQREQQREGERREGRERKGERREGRERLVERRRR